MPVANSMPMSSMVGPDSRASPPPPDAESDSEIDTNNSNNNNDDAHHEQNELPNLSTPTASCTTTTAHPFIGDHHYREQDLSHHLHDADSEDENVPKDEAVVWEDDEYVNEDDDVWGDEGGDDGEYDEEPDPVYVADLLRQSGINWMQYPMYATHRLIVTSTTPTTAPGGRGGDGQEDARQYYQVMAQFLVPASAVFRDFLHGVAPLTSDNEGDNGDDEGREEFQRARLACLQDEPLDPSLENNAAFLNTSSNAPDLELSLLEPLAPYIYRRYAPYEPYIPSQSTPVTERDPLSHQPWVHLSLPHPHHFAGLLQAIYTMDLAKWEETCFRPETIAAITATVSRLECSSTLTMCCLEYYRRIKAILSVEEFEQMQEGRSGVEDVEELRRLYRAAVEGGMLPPDPDL
ncbi:hypothetical protein BGW39_005916 [Mortierella sp. 14UC]|nr:hypothetical protein BGW39_005916 [Mortierella sp. 14UC]